ncbi:MAG: ABC transporter ATP-binding protein [Gammaproteobacteria bacterium]
MPQPDRAIHIELDDICKDYDEHGRPQRVLEGVSAQIPRGELVVLVGRSGSGKSTLLNIIGGLDRPSRGELRIGGQALSELSEDGLAKLRRREIGFVFQFFNLVPTLTALENLLLPLDLLGVDRDEAQQRAQGWLETVGLPDRGNSFPEEMSGGEQQRIALARALIHRPGLVIADEPTGNLDLETAQQVLSLLDDLCRREGTTLVMATHSPEVVGVADRVFTIHEGRLEISTP